MRARARALVRLMSVLSLAASAGVSAADAEWIETGDLQMRIDLQLLNDAEVIVLPVNQWPVPRAAVRYAIGSVKEAFVTNAAVLDALARVRARLADRPKLAFDLSATGGSPALLRGFDTAAREDVEFSAGAHADSGRFAASVVATQVGSPDDGQSLRLDGSHATVHIANWLVSANALDRWWGPGQGSLILSNNARPMPTFALERAEARPFENRFLHWLGPWRFNLAVSQMETERADIDKPLFMAWRVTVMPFDEFELGFSRTAQFCGEQLACDFSSITEMLIGNDNIGIDASEANEPGNQMAGFDIRWSSPIGELPYAVYAQMIGEDESGFLPAKYLNLFGLEVWKPLAKGGILQFHAEYSDSTCSANRSNPRFNCAYNQRQFSVEGYRYRGRVIGHTTDSDAESFVVGGTLLTDAGETWTASARSVRLNRDAGSDPRNTVSDIPARYESLELGWKGQWLGQDVRVQLGAESLERRGSSREIDAFGFVGIRYEFEP